MEADQIATHHRLQNLVAIQKGLINVTRGERCMHRHPDLGVDVLSTKKVGNQQHIGIVNPYNVSLLILEMLRC